MSLPSATRSVWYIPRATVKHIVNIRNRAVVEESAIGYKWLQNVVQKKRTTGTYVRAYCLRGRCWKPKSALTAEARAIDHAINGYRIR